MIPRPAGLDRTLWSALLSLGGALAGKIRASAATQIGPRLSALAKAGIGDGPGEGK
jgi:hypothetical protein